MLIWICLTEAEIINIELKNVDKKQNHYMYKKIKNRTCEKSLT